MPKRISNKAEDKAQKVLQASLDEIRKKKRKIMTEYVKERDSFKKFVDDRKSRLSDLTLEENAITSTMKAAGF